MRNDIEDDTSVLDAFLACKSTLTAFVKKKVFGKSEVVEDIVQETFLQTFARSQNSEIESPTVYMFQTAKHLSYRENGKLSSKIMEYVDDYDDIISDNDEPDAFDYLIRNREQIFLKEALELLPEKCRQVTVLRLFNGYQVKEIADILNISLSTAEKHLAKGIDRCDSYLRQTLGGLDSSIEEPNNMSAKSKQGNY